LRAASRCRARRSSSSRSWSTCIPAKTPFYSGKTRLHLGTLYGELAGKPGLSPAAQLEHWRKARERLANGKVDFDKVRATYNLEGTEAETYEVALASLAKAEAAVARLSARN
jgi:hypothetical protein